MTTTVARPATDVLSGWDSLLDPASPEPPRPSNPAVQAHRALLSALLDAETRLPPAAPDASAPLPHAQQATSVAVLSEDRQQREALVAALPPSARIEVFAEPLACVLQLREESAQWQKDAREQQLMVARWLKGEPLVPMVQRYLRQREERGPLVNVLAADLQLLMASGPEVLAELVDWPGHRIVLTDGATEGRQAHRCLGDYFLDKASPDLPRALAKLVADLGSRPHPRTDGSWRATLNREQLHVLREASVAEDLGHYARQNFTEWVLLGDPFGILGRDRSSGALQFLQLELRSGLPRLARLAARAGQAPEAISALRSGACLFDVDLRQSLCSEGTASVLPAFCVGYTGELLAAIRRL